MDHKALVSNDYPGEEKGLLSDNEDVNWASVTLIKENDFFPLYTDAPFALKLSNTQQHLQG